MLDPYRRRAEIYTTEQIEHSPTLEINVLQELLTRLSIEDDNGNRCSY